MEFNNNKKYLPHLLWIYFCMIIRKETVAIFVDCEWDETDTFLWPLKYSILECECSVLSIDVAGTKLLRFTRRRGRKWIWGDSKNIVSLLMTKDWD